MRADVCVGVRDCFFACPRSWQCTYVCKRVSVRVQIRLRELKDDGLQNLGLVSLGVTEGGYGKLLLAVGQLF